MLKKYSSEKKTGDEQRLEIEQLRIDIEKLQLDNDRLENAQLISLTGIQEKNTIIKKLQTDINRTTKSLKDLTSNKSNVVTNTSRMNQKSMKIL